MHVTSSTPKAGSQSSRPTWGDRSIREQLTDYAPDHQLVESLKSAGRFVVKHWSVITPVALVGLTAVRLLAVAHGDYGTALAILQHADTTKLLFGVAIQLVLLGWVGLGFVLGWTGLLRWQSLAVAAGIAATVVPLGGLVIGALPVVCVLAARCLVPPWHRLRRHLWLGRWFASGPLLIALGVLLGMDGTWLPREALTFERPNGDTYTADGYVLGYDQDRAVLLDHDSRAVTVEDAELGHRSQCRDHPDSAGWPDRTLPGLVFGWTRPTPARCP